LRKASACLTAGLGNQAVEIETAAEVGGVKNNFTGSGWLFLADKNRYFVPQRIITRKSTSLFTGK